MANIRLLEKQSDILITFLSPQNGASDEDFCAVRAQALAAFQIHDMGIFG